MTGDRHISRAVLIASLAWGLGGMAHAGEYRVVAGDIPPFSYLDHGQPAGIAVDVLKALELRENMRFHIEVMAWTRAQAVVAEHPDMLIVPLTRIAERESRYTWIAPLFNYHFVFATTRIEPPATLEQARPLVLVTLKNNAISSLLPRLGFDSVGYSASEEINARRLHAGLADAWIAADLVAPDVYRRAGFDPSELKYSTIKVGAQWEVTLAGSQRFSRQDADTLSAAIERLRQRGTLDEIIARYRRGAPYKP